MMTDRQLIERFLELQEHPEQVTDAVVQHALEDLQMRELLEQMAFAKRAFRNEELQNEEPDVEREWEKFIADEDTTQDHSRYSIMQFRKMAATFIGVVFALGIAFAAVHIVRHAVGGDLKSPTQEMQITDSHQQKLPAEAVKADTVATMQPVVFDNVPLEKILPQIAAYYQVDVLFQNEATSQLRFHFVWKPEDGLDHAIEKLNRFESLEIGLEENMIIVE